MMNSMNKNGFLVEWLLVCGGGRGSGPPQKKKPEVYGRREKKGREVGLPSWREAGEIGRKYETLRNISQSKKSAKRLEPTKIGREPGLEGMGSGGIRTPCPPPHLSCPVS